ncbi:MAG: flagellar basal body P-ring formation chaperone FlgA [Spongiibacter sp.]|nr:flagellar basal body P-ring formation chaperone FlgA [Spongiibacter sp.]
MNIIQGYVIGCGLLSLVLSSTGYTAEIESAARITATAKAYISARHPWQNQKHRVAVGKLDPRTKLPKCAAELRAFLPPGAQIQRRTTVGVRCSAGKPWKIYLPVTVSAYANVMVAKHPIAPGRDITAADVSWVERDVSTLSYGYVRSLKQAGGFRSRRSIAQGAVLTPNMLEASSVISKGQRVELSSSGSAIQVTMMGIALEDGALGSRIKVKNLSSGKHLEGTVASDNRVRLN